MNFAKTSLAILIAGVGLVGHAQAASIHFGAGGSTGSILFAANVDGATLSTTVGFTLLDNIANPFTATSATFNVSVTNNSSGPGQNAFMSFGITTVAPSLLSSADTSGLWDTALGADLTGNFKNVAFCAYTANHCNGGAIGSGIAEGATSTFLVTLTTAGNFKTNGIDFTTPYGAKYQGVGNNRGSWEIGGCVIPSGSNTCDGGGGSNEIPEPTSLLLAGLGLVGLGAIRRSKKA